MKLVPSSKSTAGRRGGHQPWPRRPRENLRDERDGEGRIRDFTAARGATMILAQTCGWKRKS